MPPSGEDALKTTPCLQCKQAGHGPEMPPFHLYPGQPFPPSRVRYELFELWVSLKAVIRFARMLQHQTNHLTKQAPRLSLHLAGGSPPSSRWGFPAGIGQGAE